MDFEGMTDEELHELIDAAQTELGRRQTAEVFEQQVNELYESARASGAITAPEQGEQWEQPTHAGDAYAKGDVVTHDGQRWVSTVTPNVWIPGQSGWHHVAEPDPETGEPGVPDFVPPTGAHDIYSKGNRVLYNGNVYESLIDNNSWSPTDYPAGWKLVTDDEEPEDEPVDGEPAELPDWDPNYDYITGDTFTYEGTPYRVRQNHTSQAHWTPDAVPALYEKGSYEG